MSKTKVIVTRKLPARVQSRMGELFDVELNSNDSALSRDALQEAMQRADVLVSTLNDRIDADLLDKAKGRLKLIANYGSGVDHIDIEAAHYVGVMVSNSPTRSAADAGDMAIALILSVLRRLKEGSNVMSSGAWLGWSPTAFLGTRLRGKTLGILGLGRIGTALAERAAVFGLNVAYYSRNPAHPDTEARLKARYYQQLSDLLAVSDIVAVCIPLNDETHHILDAERFAQMKTGAYVINIARGDLIDEEALIDALKTGHLAGAGLDVLATTTQVNADLRDLSNVMLLPHMGSATAEARDEMGETVIRNIKMYEDGHRPPNLIIPNL